MLIEIKVIICLYLQISLLCNSFHKSYVTIGNLLTEKALINPYLYRLRKAQNLRSIKGQKHFIRTVSENIRHMSDNLAIESLNMFSQNFTQEYRTKVIKHNSIRCYCLSDIHTDTDRNQLWIQENCYRKHGDVDAYTIMIIPGDIGSDIDRIEKVFKTLTENFDLVCYIPGNHELWRRGMKASSIESPDFIASDSIVKLSAVLDSAKRSGVVTSPITISYQSEADGEERQLSIFPLFAWYHGSWDKEPELTNQLYLDVEEAFPFYKKWGDFSLCSWPPYLLSDSHVNENTILAEAFASLNEQHLARVTSPLGFNNFKSESHTVISFSHFLPLQENCIEKRFLTEPQLTKVVGSDYLADQVRRLSPHMHLYGHTHIPMDLEHEGIHYIQWPLGYFREADKQCQEVVRLGPLLVFDSSLGDGSNGMPPNRPSKGTYWSKYYQDNRRQPNETSTLAPWVQANLERYTGLVFTRQKRLQEETKDLNS